MGRPTKKQVDAAIASAAEYEAAMTDVPELMYEGGNKHQLVLAAEVRALREELEAVRVGVWKWLATDNEDPQDLLDVIKEKP